VSLGYLWHQPQEQLLADMIANDIEAVLVKVRLTILLSK
jgi:diphthamide synthase (EF-2-diphthine--ammonia ligase)